MRRYELTGERWRLIVDLISPTGGEGGQCSVQSLAATREIRGRVPGHRPSRAARACGAGPGAAS